MIFHWSLSDSKSPQISRTFLSILLDPNNAVILIASTCTVISKSSSLFTNLLEIVPSMPNTIGITVTFMFHSFFVLLQGLGICLSLFAFFFFFLLLLLFLLVVVVVVVFYS